MPEKTPVDGVQISKQIKNTDKCQADYQRFGGQIDRKSTRNMYLRRKRNTGKCKVEYFPKIHYRHIYHQQA